MTPRVVFGIPLYEAAPHLREALESLLSQRDVDCAFVTVDDGRDAETPALIGQYAATDARLYYERNQRRLGLAGNWRRAFERSQELYPDAELFAWGSDHDVWHPDFARTLTETLDARPDAAMAYARDAVLTPGNALRRRHPSIDTTGIASRRVLHHRLAREMRAGQMVYGVFRCDVLRRAGALRAVLFPDRLLLTEAALQGALVEVHQILWYKRKTAGFSIERQRRAIFPGGAPRWAALPWWLVHAEALRRSWGPGESAHFLASNASRAAGARLARK